MLFSKGFYYYCWAFFCLTLSFGFLGGFIWSSIVSSSVFVDFSYSSLLSLDFSPCLVVTPVSLLFSFVVLLITFCVMIFSSYYMSSGVKTFYFVWLTVMFVASMLIVINFGDLFSVMLGWDGLGVVSFFLIVYYQSPVSTFSGLFTLFMNRLGDGLLLVSIVLLFYTSAFSSFLFFSYSAVLSFSLVSGLSTKSAIFPFSPWLPAAMAAPTPISSLVHSSTLVTAGLYLMIRFGDYLYSVPSVCSLLCVCSVFTSFYAGLNSLVEVDLKKVVALSTLSHLGFIGLAFSIGWSSLAFIHLISHAAFKSLLFMSLGSIMVSLGHYQESRYLSSAYSFTPVSSCLMMVAIFSLLGFPFFSGFYSKDYVLEVLGYSSFSGWVSFIVYLNLLFTFSYALRIFSSVYSFSKVNSLSCVVSYPNALFWSLSLLSIIAITVVGFLVSSFFWVVLPLPVILSLKYFPAMMVVVVFSFFMIFSSHHYAFKPFNLAVSSSMLFLSFLWSNGVSSSFGRLLPFINKSLEYGVVNSTLNISPIGFSISVTKLLVSLLSHVYFLLFLSVLVVLWL